MTKFPLIDLAYGKFITILFDNKENPSTLAHRSVIKVKARNQIGGPTVLTDIPEGALRYVPPKHAFMPQTGVFVLWAGSGGVGVISEELNLMKGEVFEKLSRALTNAESAIVAKEIESKMQLKTAQEQMSDQLQIVKDVKDTQQFFPFNTDYRRKAEELIEK